MSKRKLPINDNLNEINITNEIVLIKGNRTPTVDAWYKISKENLTTAKILLENMRVNHAVFFIQQSVECLVKAFFLESEILNADKVSNIGHNPSSAFEQLYEKIGYEQGVEYCHQIPEMLNKKSSFEEKLILGASLANQFTTAFKDYKLKIQSTIMSLDTSKYESSITALCIEEKIYFQNMLLVFSCLFTHEVEKDARYFALTNNGIILPMDIFSTTKVIEGLPSFINALDNLMNYFLDSNKI